MRYDSARRAATCIPGLTLSVQSKRSSANWLPDTFNCEVSSQ